MPLGPSRDLGPCIVEWGTTDLGAYWEELRVRFEVGAADVFEALFGTMPVDSVITGVSAMEVTAPFTRITLANLASIIPGGSESGSSGVVVYDNVGASLYDLAKPLFIKPVVNGVAAANGNWLKIEKTYPIPNYDLAYNLKDQRVYPTTFKCFPHATTRKVWSIGKVNTTTT